MRKTRVVNIGGTSIGGDNPIAIQSMCNTKTRDVEATVSQILSLEKAGCEIIRVAIPSMEDADAISAIRPRIHIPLVADIHFDYRLAMAAMEKGADKIRINPGNIGSRERVQAVVDMARSKGVAIRVGVNSGSLQKDLLEKYGVSARALFESAMEYIRLIESMDYENLVISIKSSDTLMCVEACRMLYHECDYPQHLGITEAGGVLTGSVKSAVGLSLMLSEGIGDTIRVSLTADPLEEVRVAKMILRELGLKKGGIEIISCPTCGRTSIDLIALANQVEKATEGMDKDLKIAVMGCAVNGPGEAREADLGIAGGNGEGLVFARGEIIKKVREDELLAALLEELKKA